MLSNKIKRIIHFLLAFASYWYYGRPSRKLIVIGVTGTKGKSTTCRLIASVLEAGGYKVGMLTTVEFQVGEKRWANTRKMTMLGRGQIQSMLRDMVRVGCQYAVIETSSEGILQYRHYGLNYDISVFTNLGTEHSERHGGFENLRSDKGKIFAGLSKFKKNISGKYIQKIIIANGNDREANFYLGFPADKKYAFVLNGLSADISSNVKIIQATKENGDFAIGKEKFHLKIIGDFNLYNGLAAAAVGLSQEIPPEKIRAGLSSVEIVSGRMEFVEHGQPFKVVVDYAHEPLSLTALFTTLRDLVKDKQGKVIAVVGSDGGGRDISKRESMGEISGNLADLVVITDVNCFDEDPQKIAEMLAVGARKAGKQDNEDLFIETDRRLAIKKAFSLAAPGDIIAITAKGTEPVICVANGVKLPWDDRRVARELIQEMSLKQQTI